MEMTEMFGIGMRLFANEYCICINVHGGGRLGTLLNFILYKCVHFYGAEDRHTIGMSAFV